MCLVLHPGSSNIEIAAVLSHLSDKMTDVVKDSRSDEKPKVPCSFSSRGKSVKLALC